MKKLKKYFIPTMMLLFTVCILWGSSTEAAVSAPGQVTGVKQVSAISNAVTVEWFALLQNDINYKVEIGTDGRVFPKSMDAIGSNRAYLSGLNAGKTYYLRVTAYTKDNYYRPVYGKASKTIKVVTAPAGNPAKITQKAAGTDNITLSWSKVAGATGYYIEYKKDGSSVTPKAVTVTGTSRKFTKLSKNSKYDFKIYAIRKNGSFTARSSGSHNIYGLPTLPTKVTGLSCISYYAGSGSVSLECNRKASADGYQYQIYDGKKLVVSKTSNSYLGYSYMSLKASKLQNNKFFKARARAFITVGNSRKYGDWSDWTYLSQQPEVNVMQNTADGIKIEWDKISGADNYTVYVSSKRIKLSSYKKAGTTKKTSMTITKCGSSKLKLGNAYYVYVVANKKVGGKTYKSQRNIYWYKTYRL